VSTSPAPWTGTPFGDHPQPPQINRADDQASTADQIVFTVASMLGGVAAGFAGGAVWAAVADPPLASVTRQGVFLASEAGYNQRVAESLWLLVVGLVGGILVGAIVGVVGRRLGLTAIVAAVAAAAVATGIAAWSGIHVFGPDLGAQLADARPGDQVRTALTVTSDVAYLGWPIGALLGLLVITALIPSSAFETPPRAPGVR
jgi:hypothetical protein